MLKLIELPMLGKLEKGTVLTGRKYKSCNDCWFTIKEKKGSPVDEGNIQGLLIGGVRE